MTEETAVLEVVETEVDLKRKELEKINCEIEEKKQNLKKLNKREYTKQEIEISEKQLTNSVKGNASKEKIEAQKVYDNVMITGKFMNLRNPGQQVKLTYLKHADDPVKWYPFEHGKIYTIPRGFVDQINEYYYTPHFIQNDQPMDPNRPMSQISRVSTENKKYAFVPLNF